VVTAAPDDGRTRLSASRLVEQAAVEFGAPGPGAGLVADRRVQAEAATKTVPETAVCQELTERLGHQKNGTPNPATGKMRPATRPKTVLTNRSLARA
jgi:hypothetical protein